MNTIDQEGNLITEEIQNYSLCIEVLESERVKKEKIFNNLFESEEKKTEARMILMSIENELEFYRKRRKKLYSKLKKSIQNKEKVLNIVLV